MGSNRTKPHRRLNTRTRLLATAVLGCFAALPAWAQQPTGMSVQYGTASQSTSGNVLTITNSNGAILHWDSFSIAKGYTTYFQQASASSSVLNRVVGASPSQIYGTLSSNGKVWLINPNGVLVGAGGVIDTAGFVGSTLDVSNANFLAGKLSFIKTPGAKDFVNQGTIKTPSGGSVYLVGANVSNEGVITTPQGETILAAGETVDLIDTGTPGVKVEITGAAGDTTNLGEIVAEAGRIGMAGVIVRNSGTLNASSVVNEGGRVFLKASQDTYVQGNGKIAATGAKGGRVEVLGNRVAVMDNAEIDVSGTNGGGTILVGGDYQGKNTDVQNSTITYFGPNAKLKADATDKGDGGKVIVWADDTTRAYGAISARGGANGGNGGFVETSGHRYLDVNGIRVDTRAPGNLGTWLLDPSDIIITHGGANSQITGATPFFPTQGAGDSSASILSDATINTALQGMTNVTITTNGGSGSGYGDIIFQDDTVAISFTGSTGAAQLTLAANRDIVLRGTVTNNSTLGSPRTLVLTALGKIETPVGATFNLAGANSTEQITAQVNAARWDNYGTVSLSGNAQIDLSSGAIFDNKAGAYFNSDATNNAATLFVGSGGTVMNEGTMYVSTALSNKVFESRLNSTGIFRSDGGADVFLDGGASFSGTVDLHPVATVGTLVVGNDTTADFNNVTFGNSGTIYVGFAGSAGTANFTGSNAGGVNVILGGTGTGVANVQNGNTILGNLQVDSSGTLNLSDAILAVGNNISTSTGTFNFSGNVGLVAVGALSLDKAINTSGTVLLAGGWDGTSPITNPTTSAAGGVTLTNAAVQASAATIRAGTGGVTLNTSHIVTDGDIDVQTGGSFATAGTNSFLQSTGATGKIGIKAADISLGAAAVGQIDATSVVLTALGNMFVGTATGSGLNLSGAELAKVGNVSGTTSLTLNGQTVTVDGVSAANSGNVGNVTINSTTGGISFGTAKSTFKSLTGNAYSSLSVAGDIETTAGDLILKNAMNGGNLTADDDLHFASGSPSLTSAGDIQLGNSANVIKGSATVNLNAAGNIRFNILSGAGYFTGNWNAIAGGSICAENGAIGGAAITLNSGGSMNLTTGVNATGTLSATAAGDVTIAGSSFTLSNASSLVKSTGGNVSIATTSGAIALNDGKVEALNHAVTLDAATSISQTANSAIKANTLTATARAGFINLAAANNLVSTLNASATATVAFKSALDLTIGSLSGSGFAVFSDGNLGWNYTGGDLTLDDTYTLGAGGDLMIAASNGSLTYDYASLTTGGSIVLGAGGNLDINSALSNGNGGIGLIAGNTLNVSRSLRADTGGIVLKGNTINVSADVRDAAGTAADGGIAIIGGNFNAAGMGAFVRSDKGDIIGVLSGNLSLSNGASMEAGKDITLGFAGTNSTLSLASSPDGLYKSYLLADSPHTINLAFPGRYSGGVVIDGVETTTSAANGSGLFVVNRATPAVAGAGLNLVYATKPDTTAAPPPATLSTVIRAVNDASKPPVTAPGSANPPPATTAGDGNGTTTTGGGDDEFAGKDKEGQNNSGSNKDDKPNGRKPIGRCNA